MNAFAQGIVLCWWTHRIAPRSRMSRLTSLLRMKRFLSLMTGTRLLYPSLLPVRRCVAGTWQKWTDAWAKGK